MKILKLSLVCLLVLILAPRLAFCAGLGYLRLSLTQGEVQVKTQDVADFDLAPVNMPLAEGDELWVPPGGRAELQLNSGSYIRLDGNSSLQVLSLDRDASQFYLPQGRAYVHFSAPERSILQLDSPDASTRAFSRASFGVDVPDTFTDVAVYKGHVETENAAGKIRVEAGQVVTLGQDSYAELAPLGLAGDWEEWNRMRDRRLVARRGGRYLPPELAVYAADLDRSGRWVDAPGYGYVWTPTVSDPEWSPYRDGRWIWRGGEYVWIAFEPWGWAPYHYGRWAFVSSIGWCWTPPRRGEVYWGPGYVGWVRTPEYVGWVPLAPGEPYYGRGYYGPNSVNVTNVNVTQVNINIYKNVNVNRGVTVVRRESFASPTPVRVKVDRNTIQHSLFTRSNLTPGGPDLKPGRVSYAPSAKRVAEVKLPPRQVRELRVRDIKEVRPLVKDPAQPVLAPRRAELPTTVVSTPRTPGKSRLEPAPAATRGGSAGAPARPRPPRAATPAPRGAASPGAPRAGAPSSPATTPPAPSETPQPRVTPPETRRGEPATGPASRREQQRDMRRPEAGTPGGGEPRKGVPESTRRGGGEAPSAGPEGRRPRRGEPAAQPGKRPGYPAQPAERMKKGAYGERGERREKPVPPQTRGREGNLPVAPGQEEKKQRPGELR